MFHRPRASALAVALTLALALAFATGRAGAGQGDHPPAEKGDFSEAVEGASALEGRIRAPCCWNQTLDIHGSESANELRREIRRRLKAGESQDAIQTDFVRRYGEKILAVPPGNPLKDVGVILSLLFGASGIGALFMLARWRKRTLADRAAEAAAGKKSKKKPERDAYDDEIDAELEKL
ncbi:MAG: cytochrome c-type biogenesis protein CcmH [Polyangiaceae bacterium]|nr:cytochrome c-type biogenesis protein CcmH [Polyangiaceae bacterium]